MKKRVKQAYTLFLQAYPAGFRKMYAVEMSEVFSDQVDDAAAQGQAALARLALSEFGHTAAAILRAHWQQRGRLFSRACVLAAQFFRALLRLEPLTAPDGRTSWPRAALESALLAVWGAGLVLSTYLPDPWKRLFDPLAAMILVVPLLWLLVGLARGMPRWAYPALGVLIGYAAFFNLGRNSLPLLGGMLLIALILLLWAWIVDRKKPFLPDAFRAWASSISAENTRLSFGLYGLLSLAIVLAYDNAYANSSTPWLAVSVLCMVGGSAIYSRCQKTRDQLGALASGITLALLAALLDHNTVAPPQQPAPYWIFAVWLNLMVLILAAPGAAWIVRRVRKPYAPGQEDRPKQGA